MINRCKLFWNKREKRSAAPTVTPTSTVKSSAAGGADLGVSQAESQLNNLNL